MKPALCAICGLAASDDKGGDWVEFSNYQASAEKILMHPDGLEYFCSKHINEVQRLHSLSSGEAIAKISD